MESVSDKTHFSRNDEIVFSEIDDQIVLMSIDNGTYYSLDAIATRIWELLEQPRNLNSLVATLTSEFEVDKKQCTADVSHFLEKMENNKMVCRSN